MSIILDPNACEVHVNGETVGPLTFSEFHILATLLANVGNIVSRPTILETVLEAAPDMNTRTVDMHIRRLRGKIGANKIESIFGKGYRLVA